MAAAAGERLVDSSRWWKADEWCHLAVDVPYELGVDRLTVEGGTGGGSDSGGPGFPAG